MSKLSVKTSTQLPVEIESDLLPKETWNTIMDMAPELSKAYSTRQIFRTETEARVSVLDKIHHPTNAAKYWQSVREQSVMLEQLATLSFEYRRNEVAIKRLQKTLATSSDLFDIEEAQIDLDECMFKKANMKTTAADRAREIQMWSMLKSELDDGTFDTENVDTHQLISYATRFALMAATTPKESMSSGEIVNLMGQLQTTLDRCEALGVIDQVIANLPGNITAQLQLR